MTEGPWQLPERWRWARVGEIFELQQGASMSPNRRKGISPKPFLRTSNVYWGRVDISSIDKMDFTEPEISKLALYPGDLLVCEGGAVGRTAIWNGEIDTCLYQNHIHRLRKKDDSINPIFYMFWMQAAYNVFNLYVGEESRTAIPNLSGRRLRDFIVPYPPIDEQNRIVEKLKDYIGFVIETKRIRNGAMDDIIKTFHSTLEKIFKEEFKRNTEIVSLRDIGTAYNGRASGSGNSNTRVFKTRHIYPFDLKQSDPSFMKPGQVSKLPSDRYLRSGDVLVCNIAKGTLGRVCYVEEAEDNWTVDTQVMIIRTDDSCLSKWLFYYLFSQRGQAEILRREKGVAFADKRGQTHLYPKDVLTIPIPLPSLDAQYEHVVYLDDVYRQIASLSDVYRESEITLETLGQSILENAFKGLL